MEDGSAAQALGQMPLFMLKRKYFDLIREGRKDIELRKAGGPWKNAKPGDKAVLICGRDVERRIIKAIHRGTLDEILCIIDYKRISPDLKNEKDAMSMIRKLYPKETDFVAFELSSSSSSQKT